jgi:azurin
VTLPLRLQAYERMALFLERIDPNQLVLRIHAAGLTVSQEQNLLLMTIRSEFEHNLSQQIYISDAVWEKIIDAKTDIESIINTVAGDYEKDADSRVFAETLLSVAAEKPVVEMAIHILKADMQKWAY